MVIHNNMYNVHMARYTTAEARRELSRLLDAAEKGEQVLVERRGVRFRLVLDKTSKGRPKPRKSLAVSDREVLAGEWTWAADSDGQLHFQARKRKK